MVGKVFLNEVMTCTSSEVLMIRVLESWRNADRAPAQSHKAMLRTAGAH